MTASKKNQEPDSPDAVCKPPEIEEYARENFIAFREDRTNSEVVYQRNFIRNRIFPFFVHESAFSNNLLETIRNLRDTEEVYSFSLKKKKIKFFTARG